MAKLVEFVQANGPQMIIVLTFGVIFIAFGLMIGVALKEFVTEKYRYWRARPKVEQALSKGPLFYENQHLNVLALTAARDYLSALEAQRRAVETGEHKPWEKIRLYVQPSYLFYQGVAAPSHMFTGSQADMCMLKNEVLCMVAGITQEDLSALRMNGYNPKVSEQSPYIFIPFSSGVLPYDKQAEMYPHRTLEQARAYLLKVSTC